MISIGEEALYSTYFVTRTKFESQVQFQMNTTKDSSCCESTGKYQDIESQKMKARKCHFFSKSRIKECFKVLNNSMPSSLNGTLLNKVEETRLRLHPSAYSVSKHHVCRTDADMHFSWWWKSSVLVHPNFCFVSESAKQLRVIFLRVVL